MLAICSKGQYDEAVQRTQLFFEGKKGDIEVEVALQYNDGYQESVFAFANNIGLAESTMR